MKKCFTALKKFMSNNRLDYLEERNLTRKAIQFKKNFTFHTYFKAWKFWIFSTLKLKKINNENVFYFRKKKLQKTMISFLRSNLDVCYIFFSHY